MSSGAVNPLDNPQTWDVVVVAGVTSPGICEVSEAKRASEWDIKKGKGSYGSTVTYVGRPPAKVTIKFKLWQPAHFSAWDTFRKLLKYDPTKKTVNAVDLYHPALADIDIHSVVTENIGSIVHDGEQLYSITVDFLEYFPASKKSAVSTPGGSKSNGANQGAGPGGAGAPPPDAQDAQQKQIADLLKQAQAP